MDPIAAIGADADARGNTRVALKERLAERAIAVIAGGKVTHGQARRGADLASAARSIGEAQLRGALAGVLPTADLDPLDVPAVIAAASDRLGSYRDALLIQRAMSSATRQARRSISPPFGWPTRKRRSAVWLPDSQGRRRRGLLGRVPQRPPPSFPHRPPPARTV